MRIGIDVNNFTWPGGPAAIGATFGRIARDADEAGLDSFWVMDHFFQIPVFGKTEDEMLEGYSALAFAAAQTRRIRLGTLVTGVTHRHPGVLVKQVTSLDVLSGGRAYLGIGAAWNEYEQRALGIPVRPLAERFERLEETLQVARQMWAGDETPFEGRHYQLERPLNVPNTLQRPRPPILIGGSGERKTLRLVARYADACNLFDVPGQLRHKLSVLARHCEEVGRPYGEIEKTTYGLLRLSRDGTGDTRTPAQAVDHFGTLAELGVDHVILGLPELWRQGSLDLLAEIVPQVHAIPSAIAPGTPAVHLQGREADGTRSPSR